MTLCEELGEHRDRLDWPRASVVYFLVITLQSYSSKAASLLRAPSGEKLHHDVSKLQDRYCELFPELKDAFHIETPWDVGLERAEEVFGVTLNVEGFEYNPDQVYQYMTGKNGATAKGVGRFAPGTCLLLCQRLESEFGRVWDAVNGRTGTT